MKTLLSASLVLLLTACGGGEVTWHDRLEPAQDEAAKTKRQILINFTGSDWCSWCQKLDAEVFSTPEFKNSVEQKFVLVKLDYPREKTQSDAVKEYNSRLAGQYGVEGFPTILLLDSAGRVYARTGYKAGGAKAWLSHLDAFADQKAKRDLLLKNTARETAMPARLDAFISAVSNFSAWGILGSYPELKTEIINLDSDNARGLRAKYMAEAAVGQVMQRNFMKNDWEGGLATLENLLKEFPKGEAAQLVLYHMAIATSRLGRTDAAKLHLRSAIMAAPKSDIADMLHRSIDSLEANPD